MRTTSALLIGFEDQLRPASPDLELDPALEAGRLYVGDHFAVDMGREEPLILFDEAGHELYGGFRKPAGATGAGVAARGSTNAAIDLRVRARRLHPDGHDDGERAEHRRDVAEQVPPGDG